MKTFRTFLAAGLTVALGTLFLAGLSERVSANSTPQTLPFTQNWSVNLITTTDDWSPVPGIVGFLGDDTTTSQANRDPRGVLQPFTTNDVIANLTNATSISGGVGEFEIANPTIGLQGSGTADNPNIVLYLNTTGQSNIRVAFNAIDIDDTADDAVQPVNMQYRVGSTGNFINVFGTYHPDVTVGGAAGQVTAVAGTLPPAANNQPVVEVRIMTTNAGGSDEWVGIDDISVTTSATPAVNRANADFNGDGRTDYAVTRAAGSQLTWYINYNGTGQTAGIAWGLDSDQLVPEDFDGDGKDDVAIWRPEAATVAAFYILNSGSNTVRIEQFGQSGDQINIVGDYDGDGKADPSSFRCPQGGGQCIFYYRGSLNNPGQNVTFVPWGFGTTDTVTATGGDFDGDGKFDFCVRRDAGGGQGQFVVKRSSDGATEWVDWGLVTDPVIPGDFDGDGRNDFTVVRFDGSGTASWYVREADGGGTGAAAVVFGNENLDFGAWGDYDGDGKQDMAVWRPGAQTYFIVRNSSTSQVSFFPWGTNGDTPVAEWNGGGGGN